MTGQVQIYMLMESVRKCRVFRASAHLLRRDGRVVDYNGLENRRTERYRGFESLSLRNIT